MVLRWVPVAVGVLGVAAALPSLVGALRHHPYFEVREVRVRTDRRLGVEEVRRVAGVEPGASTWDIDPAAVEARLAAHPWVHAATVRRELPGRIVVQVREKRPAAILALRGPGSLHYVDRAGRLIAPVARRDSRDLPFVTGLAAADLAPVDGFGAQALRRALALLRAAARVRGLAPASEVHVDRVRGLTLLLLRPAVPIEVGWEGFASRLERLPRVLTVWAGRQGEMAGVDLRFEDQVIVRVRDTGGTAARRGPARGREVEKS